MLTVIAKLLAKENKLEDAIVIFKNLIPTTIQEKGCVQYDLKQDTENANLFFFVEKWETKADLEAHLNNKHMITFKEVVPELLASPLEIFILKEA